MEDQYALKTAVNGIKHTHSSFFIDAMQCTKLPASFFHGKIHFHIVCQMSGLSTKGGRGTQNAVMREKVRIRVAKCQFLAASAPEALV